MCNRCASFSSSSILNKLNSFSGIDLKIAFSPGATCAMSVAECFSSGTKGQLAAYFVGFLLGARRGTWSLATLDNLSERRLRNTTR